MRFRAEFCGDARREVLFHLEDIGSGGESRTPRNAENVRVNGDYRTVVNNRRDDICSLASYAGEGLERIRVIRHFPSEIGHELARHTHQMPGLAVGV